MLVEPLLTTKFLFPPVRPNLVPRPALVDCLSDGLHVPLTLISAPAGYGKTTLLAEWRAGPGQDIPLAWLSLDEGDNDLARFLRYLVAALQNVQPGIGEGVREVLQLSQQHPSPAILGGLINEIAALPINFALVLDDYHVIETDTIHQIAAFLIDHLPSQMHLVLLTRADPPLPLARLRARAQLVEIRARDLRFSALEARTFLNDVMELNLSAENIQVLLERTEGWIAGLQLAALSIKGHENPAHVIATFGGGYHTIVDFLFEEVLSHQPEPLRMFLLQTSILDRLSGPLCDAITGSTGGEETLEQLHHANLFVSPLGGECCWYRYHHLFADVTRNRLRHRYPDQVPKLHRRASIWYEQNRFLDQAIQHALEARDYPRAATLVEKAGKIAIQRGEFYKYKTWMESLPKSEITNNPRLYVDLAWTTALGGDFEKAEDMLEKVKPAVQEDTVLKVDWLSAKVWAARGLGEGTLAIDLALEALAHSEPGSLISRSVLLMSLSLAYWHEGMVAEAAMAAEEALPLAEKACNWHVWVILSSRIALAKAAQGDLRGAEKVYLHALAGSPDSPAWAGGGMAQQYLAALYYEWNELEQAHDYAKLGLEYSQITGYTEVWVNSLRQLAYIYQAQGELEKANESLDGAERVFREHRLPGIFFGVLAASRFQVALCQGDIEAAAYWIDQFRGGYGGSFHYLKLPLEPAKLSLARGDKAAASGYLSQCFKQASQRGILYAQIEIRILQALASHDETEGLKYICDALNWAEPERFVRVFIDQGAALIPLLRAAAQSGVCPGYAVRLLSVLEAGAEEIPLPVQPLVDPLSQRELEVLSLLAIGKSNQEIADELFIALGTVKKHLYNIFSKLNVRSRTECVARARELKLLP